MVAESAQVSIATASLALAGDSRVALTTRKRVETAAHSLGYVRDIVLSSLAGGRFRHAGKPIIIATMLNDAEMDLEFQREAIRMQIGMVLHPMRDELATCLATAQEIGAKALVLHRRGMNAAFIANLPLPAVLWEDENPGELTMDVVELHEWWGSVTGAVQRLQAAGFRRIGVVLTPASPRHWHDDVRLAAVNSCGLANCETHEASELSAFIQGYRPDAVLGGSPWVGAELTRLQVEVPFASLIVPPGPWHQSMAGWVPNVVCRQQVTLELIEQRLRYGPRSPRRIIVPPIWRPGSL